MYYFMGKLFATQALSQTQKNVSEQREGHDMYRFVSATHVLL